jgi:hypothetical protein
MTRDSGSDSADLVALESVRAVRESREAELAAAEERVRYLAQVVAGLATAEADIEEKIQNRSGGTAIAVASPAAGSEGRQTIIDVPAVEPGVSMSLTLTDEVASTFAEQPLRTFRAQEIAAIRYGPSYTKAQLDTVRTIIARLIKRGRVIKLDRGLFQWGGNASADADA